VLRVQEDSVGGQSGHDHTFKRVWILSVSDVGNLGFKAFFVPSSALLKCLSGAISVSIKPDQARPASLKLPNQRKTMRRETPIEGDSIMTLTKLSDEKRAAIVPYIFQFRVWPPSGMAFQVVVREAVLSRQVATKCALASCRYAGQQDYCLLRKHCGYYDRMWNVKITGPDADGLMWFALSHPEKGSVAFIAPVDSVRGEIMKRAREDSSGTLTRLCQ
jgi:hypothetical protein